MAQLAWRDMLAITNDYDVLPTLDHANRMLVRKTLAANAVKATVAQALEVVGGAGYFRRLGLERLLRDLPRGLRRSFRGTEPPNVAVTRARLRLYVIGNERDWATCRYLPRSCDR